MYQPHRKRAHLVPAVAGSMFACLASAVVWLSPTATAQSTAVEKQRADQAIDSLGLGHLRVSQLERKLEEATARETKVTIAEDLARAYLQEVQRGEGAVPDDLRSRIDAFLAAWEVGSKDSLLVRVAQRDYQSAARTAEDARRGGVSAADLDRARAVLTHADRWSSSAARRLGEIRSDAVKAVARASGQERVRLERGLELLDDLLLEARFRSAWSAYWLAWLSRASALADEARQQQLDDAMRRFGVVLEIDSGVPRPADASLDLRGAPYYASAIEGMALTQALAGRAQHDASIATAWLELLRDPATASASRDAVGELMLLAAADSEDWARVAELINAGNCPARALEAVAVAGLSGTTGGAGVRHSGSDVTLGALYALAQSMEYRRLAGLKGVIEASGATLPPEVAWLLSSSAALVAAEDEVGDERAVHARAAVEPLRKLLSSDTATGHMGLTRSLRASLGWALMQSGRHAEAAVILQRAGEEEWEQAERVLWLAILAKERALGASGAADSGLATLRAEYSRRFGASGKQSELVVRDSASRQPPDGTMAAALRQIPPHDPAWPEAQRELSRIAYWSFRNGLGESRLQHARALLSVAVPTASPAAAGAIVRRQLEASLDEGVADLVAADSLLELADETLDLGTSDPSVRAELQCRRVQRALLAGDVTAACDRLQALSSHDSLAAAWRSLARRSILRAAERAWATAQGAGEGAESCIAAIVLEELETASSSDPATIVRLSSIVAESREQAVIARALAALKALPADIADGPQALEVRGRLLEASGQSADAVQSYTRAVNAIRQGDGAWYRVKARLAALLERTDPEAARAMLRQHRALDPQWGPGRDGEALRAAAGRLGVEAAP